MCGDLGQDAQMLFGKFRIGHGEKFRLDRGLGGRSHGIRRCWRLKRVQERRFDGLRRTSRRKEQ